MGGGLAIASAAAHPARFAAVATFHAGNLATDSPTSPHRVVHNLRAELYIASAENDDTYPSEMAARFEAALKDGGVAYTAETYTGANHGWMVPDFPSHHHESAERGWKAVLALFDRTLRVPAQAGSH